MTDIDIFSSKPGCCFPSLYHLLPCFVPLHNILIFGANSRIRFDHAAQPGGDSPAPITLHPRHLHLCLWSQNTIMLSLLVPDMICFMVKPFSTFLSPFIGDYTLWCLSSSDYLDVAQLCPLSPSPPTVFPVHTPHTTAIAELSNQK